MDSTVRVLFLGNASSALRSVGQLERGFGGLGRAASTAGKLIGVGIVGGLAAAVKAAVTYDRAMRNVNSIAKLNEGQFKRLSKQVLQLAKDTGQGPKTLAEGLYDIVSSGFKASDGLKILRASAKAASAGLTDTATSTKAVVAVLNAYHLGAGEAEHVSDVLFQTVNKGVLSFEELASQIGDVLPIAAQLGVPLEDIGGALATITLHGVSAAEASTQLKQTLVSILKPSESLQKTIEAMGYASGEAALKTLGLEGFLQRLSTAAHGSGAAFADWFPNVRAMNGALGLTGKNIATLHQNLQAMRSSQGATQAAFAEQGKSISFQWQRAKASLTAAAIPIGQLLFPLLAKAADKVGEFAQSIQSHMPQIRAAFGDIATVVGGIGSQLGALAGTSGGQSAIVGLLATLATAKTIGGTKNFLGGLVGGMRALGPAGTIAAVGVGILTGAWYLATHQGKAYEQQIRNIKSAIDGEKAAVMTHKDAVDNLVQARINVSTTTRQASAAEVLYKRSLQETGAKSEATRSALDNMKQSKLNAKNATEDLTAAEKLERDTRVKANQAHKATAKAFEEFDTKARRTNEALKTLADREAEAAKKGSGIAESNRRIIEHNIDRAVDRAADATARLARQLGAGAGKAQQYSDAVRALVGQLGRMPTFKEVKIYVTTINRTVAAGQYPHSPGANQTGRATGGMIPGATGKAISATVHAGEMVLTPTQQMALGGPRFLSDLFGFSGARGPNFAIGGIVGSPGRSPDRPKIRKSKKSPHTARRPRTPVQAATAEVKAALADIDKINDTESLLDRSYGQLAREYDISQETFLVDITDPETGDSYQIVDAQAVAQRVGEIDSLIGERQKMLGLIDQEKILLQKALDRLRNAVRKLVAAIKAEREAAAEAAAQIRAIVAAQARPGQHTMSPAQAKSEIGRLRKVQAGHLSKAEGYSHTLGDYRSAIGDKLKDVPSIPLDRRDVELDIQTLNAERVEVVGSKAPPRQPGLGSGGAGGEGAGGAGGADTTLVDYLMGQVAQLSLALGIQKAQLPILGAFQRGTLHVPETGLYQLHAGEQVRTAGTPAISTQTADPAIVYLTLSGGISEQDIDMKIEGATDRVIVKLGTEADRRAREGR